MSNEVLVKRLHVALLRRQTQDSWTWGEQQHLIDVLSDAITALSQPTYDDGLEAAAQWHDAEAVRCLDEATFCEREGMPACKALHEESAQEHRHSAECIRSLKSKPANGDTITAPTAQADEAGWGKCVHHWFVTTEGDCVCQKCHAVRLREDEDVPTTPRPALARPDACIAAILKEAKHHRDQAEVFRKKVGFHLAELDSNTRAEALEALAEKLQGAGAKGETLVEWHQRIGGCNREVAQLCAELDRRLDAMEVK